ncbi:MAG: dTDP-glucose 4,6-dehydratase [Acidimicrobiia bacterium]
MPRYLVTGGAGFIGSTFIRHLLGTDPDATVTNLDLLTYAGLHANVAELDQDDRHEFVHGDVADAALVDTLMDGIDIVVNFAAESHVDRSIAGPAVFLRSNILGTGVLLDAARRRHVPTFVQVSSDEVYGPVPTGAADEEAPLRPSSPYAASKAAADMVVASYRHTYGYEAIVTRSTNNYGPYQHPEKLIPLAITRLLEGGVVPVYGDGKHEREWLWVDDHVAAIRLLIDEGTPGETYNIGSGEQCENLDVVERLIGLVGSGSMEHVTDRPGHDRRYGLDTAKLRALGWKPTVDLDEGLARTVAWYREHRDWWEPLVTR